MVMLAVSDTDELEGVVAKLQRALDELQTGTDDAHAVLAQLADAGEDLEDFTARFRQVIGG